MAFSEEERSSSTRVAELIDRAWKGEKENTRIASGEQKVPNPEKMSTSRISQSAAQGVVYKVPHPKCLYTYAHSTKNKQDEFRALAQSLGFDITDMSEACGDDSSD